MIKTIKPMLNTVKAHGVIPVIRSIYIGNKSKGITWQNKYLDAHILFISPMDSNQSMNITIKGHFINGFVFAKIMNFDEPKQTLTLSNTFDPKTCKPLVKYTFNVNIDAIERLKPNSDYVVTFVKDNRVVGIYDLQTVQGWKEKPTNDLLKILEGFNPFTL